MTTRSGPGEARSAQLRRSDRSLERLTRPEAVPAAAGYLLCQLAYLGYDGPELATAVDAIFARSRPTGRGRLRLTTTQPAPRESEGVAPMPPTDGPALRHHADSRSRCGASPRPGSPPTLGPSAAYEWLLGVRLPDGSWPAGPKADLGEGGRPSLPEKEYRRLARGEGCRSATTGAVACLALHPERRRSEAARIGVDHLLARETRDESTLGWEISRLVGLERAMGQITFYVTFDLGLRPRPRLPMRRLTPGPPSARTGRLPRDAAGPVRPLATPGPPTTLRLAHLRPREQPSPTRRRRLGRQRRTRQLHARTRRGRRRY